MHVHKEFNNLNLPSPSTYHQRSLAVSAPHIQPCPFSTNISTTSNCPSSEQILGNAHWFIEFHLLPKTVYFQKDQ